MRFTITGSKEFCGSHVTDFVIKETGCSKFRVHDDNDEVTLNVHASEFLKVTTIIQSKGLKATPVDPPFELHVKYVPQGWTHERVRVFLEEKMGFQLQHLFLFKSEKRGSKGFEFFHKGTGKVVVSRENFT